MIRTNKIFLSDIFRLLLLIAAATVTGCASQSKYAKFQPLPRGTTVYVVAVDPQIAVPDAETLGETIGKESAKGAGMGLVGGLGGGIYLSVLCGPAIIICAPVLVPAGAAVGLVGGTAMGAGKAGAKALPKEKAESLERIMSSVLQEAKFSEAMQSTFIAHSGDRWILSNNAEAVKVTLGLEALNLTQLEDDILAIRLTASMIIEYGPGKGQTTRRFLFNHLSEGRPVDDFLADDGELFREELATALQINVDEIIAALDFSSARQATR